MPKSPKRTLTEYNIYIRKGFDDARKEGRKVTLATLARKWNPSDPRKHKSPRSRVCSPQYRKKCGSKGKVCHVGAKRRSCRKRRSVPKGHAIYSGGRYD